MTEYLFSFFFFFNDTATTEIYTLSLHDALPILALTSEPPAATTKSVEKAIEIFHFDFNFLHGAFVFRRRSAGSTTGASAKGLDRKSTRLNSSHANISYAVFCLKKKKNNYNAIYS